MEHDQHDFKVSEVAKQLRVSKAAVISWIKSGKMTAFNVSLSESARPIYRITRSAVDEFRKSREIHLTKNTHEKRSKIASFVADVHRFF